MAFVGDCVREGNATPDDILVNTNLGQLKLSEIFMDVEVTPSTFIYKNLRPNYDSTTIYNCEPLNITTSLPQMYAFNLDEINEIKMDILADVKSTNAYSINSSSTVEPYKTILKKVNTTYPLTVSQEGLAVKTYQSDLFNNWLNTASIDAINNQAKISTTSGRTPTTGTRVASYKDVYRFW